MALSAFDDKPRSPVGRADFAREGEHAPSEQWSSSGAKFGWSLRLRRKGRVVKMTTA
jgi:hypothetical protein